MSLSIKRRYPYWILAGLITTAILICWSFGIFSKPPAIVSNELVSIDREDRPVEVLRKSDLDPRKTKLGSQLFGDKRLSRDNSISCSSCHSLNRGGTDRRKSSVGMNGLSNGINAPTVLNSGFNFKQFWDGRADSLEDQIDGPIQNPAEMDSSWKQVVAKLKQIPEYRSPFNQLYPSGITSDTIKDAISTYERSLTTPNSRFDRYLSGDESALTQDEQEGYRRFRDSGCVACHQGVLLGGNLFQKFGVFGNYFEDRGGITQADYGRFNVTGEEKDRFAFKVPSLRNVELTSPYFHDGSAKTLDEAVRVMMKYQLGREAASQDIDLIIKFLTTLTGEQEGL
jgi:cytochrome c peroxidase